MALASGVFILVANPSYAYACSCAPVGLAEYSDEIAIAFVGRQIDRVEHSRSDPNGVTLTFEVDRVFKGEAATSIELTTSASSASCGTDLASRGTTGVAAFESRIVPSVSLCGSGVTEAELAEVFGAGYAPIPLPPRLEAEAGSPGLALFALLAGVAGIGGVLLASRRLRLR